MTPIERVRAVLSRRLPDRVPFNFWMDRWKMDEYDKELAGGRDFRVDYYGADVVEVFPSIAWFPSLPRHVVNDSLTTWQTASAVADIATLEKIELPDPLSPEILQPVREARSRFPDRALFALVLTHFDVLLDLRLIQDLSLDIYDHPKLLKALCGRIAGRIATIIDRLCVEAPPDALYLAGDLASSRGPLFAVETLKRFWLEEMQEIVRAAHARGVPVLYHCCGRVVDYLELFAQTGVDGINPFQAAVNAPRELLPYHDRLILYGGIDNSFAVPQGPVSRIRAHIREVFDTLGKDGGLIFSSHDIQGDTPREHLDAMVDEIKRCTY